MMHAVPFSPAREIKWLAEAAEAKRHPGVWFLMVERDGENAAWMFAQHVKKGVKVAFRPAGSFEAATRGREVYVRYIGAESNGRTT